MLAGRREAVDEALNLELERMEAMERRALSIIERRMKELDELDANARGYAEDGILMKANDQLLRISESRRKLLGMDSPAQVQLSGGVKYEIVGVDVKDLT